MKIEEMPLEELNRKNLSLLVASEVLGCRVVFAGDRVELSRDALFEAYGEMLVVYRVSELRILYKLQPPPAVLICLHHVKEIFEGSSVRDPSGLPSRPQTVLTRQELQELWDRWELKDRQQYLFLREQALAHCNDRALVASWAVEQMVSS